MLQEKQNEIFSLLEDLNLLSEHSNQYIEQRNDLTRAVADYEVEYIQTLISTMTMTNRHLRHLVFADIIDNHAGSLSVDQLCLCQEEARAVNSI